MEEATGSTPITGNFLAEFFCYPLHKPLMPILSTLITTKLDYHISERLSGRVVNRDNA